MIKYVAEIDLYRCSGSNLELLLACEIDKSMTEWGLINCQLMKLRHGTHLILSRSKPPEGNSWILTDVE
jgi:hypothetical protein